MTYAEKLKDPRWQKKRLEIMSRDGFTCRCCFSSERTLNVHHKAYKRNPWDASDSDLITLCEKCHERVKSVFEGLNTEILRDGEFGSKTVNAIDAFLSLLRRNEAERKDICEFITLLNHRVLGPGLFVAMLGLLKTIDSAYALGSAPRATESDEISSPDAVHG